MMAEAQLKGAEASAEGATSGWTKKLPFGHPDAKGFRSPLGFMLIAGPTGLLMMNLRMMFLGLQNGERIADDKRVNEILDKQYPDLERDSPERRAAFKRLNSEIVSKHTMTPVVEQRAAMFESPNEFCRVAAQGATAQMGTRGEDWGKNHKCLEAKRSITRQSSYNPNLRSKSTVRQANLEGVISAEA
jgi:hypothetical protein